MSVRFQTLISESAPPDASRWGLFSELNCRPLTCTVINRMKTL